VSREQNANFVTHAHDRDHGVGEGQHSDGRCPAAQTAQSPGPRWLEHLKSPTKLKARRSRPWESKGGGYEVFCLSADVMKYHR
jgi:hypothetical protein